MRTSELGSRSRESHNYPYLFPKLLVQNPSLYGKTGSQFISGKSTSLATTNGPRSTTLMELGCDDEHDPIHMADGEKRQRIYPLDSSVSVSFVSKMYTNLTTEVAGLAGQGSQSQ
ncbi:hypothetical protein GQ457_01G021970 [Hibiscus cannabinus]